MLNCRVCGVQTAKINRCTSCSKKGRTPWNKGLKGYMAGRIVSIETRRKASESQAGKLNHNWKGGISYRANRKQIGYLYENWKKEVLIRDSSNCTICNKFCLYAIVHHIRPVSLFPELTYIVENGKTVCYDCHMVIHQKVSGYKPKRGEFSETLNETTLSQEWIEISTKVQRILDETKELYSMSVTPARAPWAKAKIYAELTGDCKK